ncbi:MAG TPA: pyridoxamine 5'-phosphate oxidase family protein [Anaeromyxobacteraceae bacterium]|nr:pyridoxamine 5'-phosphate oxidase family protein [Anaeromyxobacteraceae bacterium]
MTGRALAETARRLLRSSGEGVLATTSLRRPGFPFASLAPYALSPAGDPLLLLSGLAQHTRNLQADPRACLLVQEAGQGPSQDRARLAVLGRVAPVAAADLEDFRARYLARHPEAREWAALADFALHLLSVEEAHLVAGFGRAGWLSRDDLSTSAG